MATILLSPEVMEVLAAPDPAPTEVPFTDLLGKRRRRNDGRTIDPDTLSVYVIGSEAALLRAVHDRMLTYYHDRQGRPVEVLSGYQAVLDDAGRLPREATVTPARVERDAARVRAWKARSKRSGPWRDPAAAPAPKAAPKDLDGGRGTRKPKMTRREKRRRKRRGAA